MSPADWIATIARAYLAAPEGSTEETLLEGALDRACERADVDMDDLLDRMIAVAPVATVVFETDHSSDNADHDKDLCDCGACENEREAEKTHAG